MINVYKKIANNRYIEDFGLYFEDFNIGDIFEHRPGRTITTTDNTWGSLISMNQHPLHIDQNFASNTEFGKILVSSLVTFCIINGMTVSTISAKAIANLGWDNVRLTAPVFIGDTLYAETEILEKRESESRKNQGIVKVKTKGYNQDQKAVITLERNFLVAKKSITNE
jgi:itaconyl-CoA hydratase